MHPRDRAEDRLPRVLVAAELVLGAQRGDELRPAALAGAQTLDVGERVARVRVGGERVLVEDRRLRRVAELRLGQVGAEGRPGGAQRRVVHRVGQARVGVRERRPALVAPVPALEGLEQDDVARGVREPLAVDRQRGRGVGEPALQDPALGVEQARLLSRVAGDGQLRVVERGQLRVAAERRRDPPRAAQRGDVIGRALLHLGVVLGRPLEVLERALGEAPERVVQLGLPLQLALHRELGVAEIAQLRGGHAEVRARPRLSQEEPGARHLVGVGVADHDARGDVHLRGLLGRDGHALLVGVALARLVARRRRRRARARLRRRDLRSGRALLRRRRHGRRDRARRRRRHLQGGRPGVRELVLGRVFRSSRGTLFVHRGGQGTASRAPVRAVFAVGRTAPLSAFGPRPARPVRDARSAGFFALEPRPH